MALILTTEPAAEPVSLTEIKAYTAEETTDADDLLTAIGIAARQLLENQIERSFITQTWTLYLDTFPSNGDPINLLRGPLQSVSSIKYYDAAGTLQTLSADAYKTDLHSLHGRISLADGYAWPELQTAKPNAVEIAYVAGFGDADDVPAAIKMAIQITAAHMYRYRDEEGPGGPARVPMAADALLDRWAPK